MAYIRLDKIRKDAHLESIVNLEENMKNGIFVTLGELLEDGETYTVDLNKEIDADSDEVVLHATYEQSYSPTKLPANAFELEKGKAGRAYVIDEGNVVSVTKDLLFGVNPEIGLPIEASTQGFKVLASGTKPTTPIYGYIKAIDNDFAVGELYVVRLSKQCVATGAGA